MINLLKQPKLNKVIYNYWYDPTNQYIKLQDPKHNLWKFEQTAKCMCLKCNLEKGAGMRCNQFENKIP